MWDSILLLDQTLYLIKYLKDVNTGLMNCADNCHTQYELVVLCTISTTIAVAWTSRPEESSSMDVMEGLATSSTTLLNCFLYCVDRPAITPGKGWLSSISTPWPPPWSSLIWKEAHHLLKFVGKFRTCQCIPLVFYPANTRVRLVFPALLTKNQCVKDSRPECTRWIIQQLQLLLCRFTLFYHLLQKSSLYSQYIQVIAASFHCLFILISQTEGRKTFLWPQWYVNSICKIQNM